MKLYYLCFLLLTTFVNSQNIKIDKIEHLKKQLSKSKDISLKIENHIDLSLTYRFYNLDSTYYYGAKAIFLARKNHLKKLEAKALTSLVIYNIEKNNPRQAQKINDLSLHLNKSINNPSGIGFNYSLTGRIYQLQSDFVNASKNYFEAEKLAVATNDLETQIWIYKNLSFLFLDQQNFAKALKFGFKARAISNKIKDYDEVAFCNGILGEIYRLKKEFTLSEKFFKISHTYFKNNNNYYGIAWVLTNWSILYDSNLDKCFEMEMEAQKIWNSISPNNFMSLANQFNIGYTYLYLHERSLKTHSKTDPEAIALINNAEKYFKTSQTIAKTNNNKTWIMNCYSAISLVYYVRNEIEAYSEYTMKYYALRDSIYSQKNKNKIAELEVAKTIDVKNKEIQLNHLKIATKEKQKWYLIGGILSLFIIGGLLFYQSRNRKKNNEKLQLLNAELDEANKAKTRFFSILNHDLRGPVANLIFFLQLQKESPELLDEESTKRMQDKTITGAENLLNSMEDILQWSKSQMENFKPQPQQFLIATLFDDVQKHFSSTENIQFVFENPLHLSIITDENYLKTILRNLTGNAIKALANIENPSIIWKAFQENGNTVLSITDNGKGASEEEFKALYDVKEVVGIKTGLGLHLIRDLAKAIDCEITVASKIDSGTTITLKL